MNTDRYIKVVLTVIALALVCLCLWGIAPKWGTPAKAAGIMPANESSVMDKMATIAVVKAAQGAGSDVVMKEGQGDFALRN